MPKSTRLSTGYSALTSRLQDYMESQKQSKARKSGTKRKNNKQLDNQDIVGAYSTGGLFIYISRTYSGSNNY